MVFLHPTTPDAAEHLALGYPRPMLEFMFDSTRAVTQLILSGALERHPSLRVIVPHAGAALPVLANRIELLLPLLAKPGTPTPDIRKALKTVHFDLAGAPVPELRGAWLSVADAAHLHYGSDFPFTPADSCVALREKLLATDLLGDETRAGVFGRNAREWFPRLS
ncbi:amidohydrolase family protein [Amycolatopsis sp. FDAARGOS 1241]|uniref:amidohydrolase family protein n=1 Tax=Amycolatopsis sp. FDAARGOS 1241 TaxID=2778070 RepID=UPI001EF2AF25|nr:amidohydrolase family protein [Amycolatopsis sp. FDAARGOS 1241]